MLSSNRSQTKSSSEQPYRPGQSLAAPPSRAAQVFSSFLKNCARCERTLSVSGSFSTLAQLLYSAGTRLAGLSGSAPRKSRIDRVQQLGQCGKTSAYRQSSFASGTVLQ